MDANTITEIVKRLVGEINPKGETYADNERFENLKVMCDIVTNLVCAIDDVSYNNSDRYEFSMKRAGEFANNYLTKSLGIVE